MENLLMQDLLGDIRYALRVLRQSPVFTLTAILTLALGIGGTTGIFSLIDAVMLRSLPVSDPASLYRIGEGNECCVEGGTQNNWGLFSFPLFERLKAAAPEFEQVAAFQAMAAEFSMRAPQRNASPGPCLANLLRETTSRLLASAPLPAVSSHRVTIRLRSLP
jgi:hypothetical protein